MAQDRWSRLRFTPKAQSSTRFSQSLLRVATNFKEKTNEISLRNVQSTSYTPSSRHVQCCGFFKFSLPCIKQWVMYNYHTNIPLIFSQIPSIISPSISSTLSRVVFLIESPKVLSAFLPLFLPYFHNPFLLVRFSFVESIVLLSLSPLQSMTSALHVWDRKVESGAQN